MFAQEALDEIEQWRLKTTSPRHQLDWRWIERYRALASYDGHWWLAHAGPFTEEEQSQWDQLFPHALDDATKEQLGKVLVQSRQRELAAAMAEQREPRLHYPAIDIAEVRKRIAALLQLDTEISQEEPNPIVRRLYHGAIEEEVDFLRLIEATYEGDSEKFRAYNRRLDLEPTPEEMDETLYQVKRILWQGLQRPETRDVSQRVMQSGFGSATCVCFQNRPSKKWSMHSLVSDIFYSKESSLTKSLQECFVCPSTQLARELSGAREKVCSMLPLQHGKIEKLSR